MSWTKAQEQAIKKRGANILVSAAAGSGKTSVLVERIINKVVNEKVDVDNILVVTFTNAAASEMKQRLLTALYKKIDENPEDANLQRQISLVNRANISTIHAFCLNVIRNNFFELGIPANFRVADTVEIEIMKQEVIEKIFEDKYEIQDKDFLKLLELYTTYRDDTPLKNIIMQTYEFSMCVPYPEKWIDDAVEEFNYEKILENDNKNFDFSETKWGKLVLEDAKAKVNDCILNLKAMKSKIEGIADLSDFYQLISIDLADIENMKFEKWDETYNQIKLKGWDNWPRKSKLSEEGKELKEQAKTVRDDAKDVIKNDLAKVFAYNSKDAFQDIIEMYPILESLKNITLEFEKEFTAKKREKNVVDFSDIEHLALKLLINDDGTPSEIAKKYNFKEILVDEYQDSNLIQEKILNSVSNGKNIFMVGDIKQSIYRFRQARPDLFLQKYDLYNKIELSQNDELTQDTKIQLYNNFRSRENILNITNIVFQDIMSKDLGEIDYNKEEYLNYSAKFDEPKIDCKVEAYVIDAELDDIEDAKVNQNKESIKLERANEKIEVKDSGKITEISEENEKEDEDESAQIVENAELEARFVAKKIKELIKNGIKYKDIAILLRSPGPVAPIYEKQLIQEGIPVFSDTSSEYLGTIEVNTIISLLKIIDNPLQDIPLVTVLRSPIGGFTENELLEIRMLDRDGMFYDALKKSQTGKVESFLQMLEEFRKDEKELPLNELIWKIYSQTGYYHYVRLMPNGNIRQANLRKLFEKAKDYEQISFKGLFNFIIFIEKVANQSSNMTAAKIIGENDDVVRIMSIHKSKGLEFPVVFLCGIAKKINLSDMSEKIIYHQDLGIGINYISGGIEYPTLSKEAIKIKMRREAISEEMRILYVALTRAKEKLIMVGTDKKVEENLAKKKEELEKYKSKDSEKINSKLVGKYTRYLDWLELVYEKNVDPKFEFNIVKKSSLHYAKQEQLEEKNIKEILEKSSVNKEKFEKINETLNWQYPYAEAVEAPSKTTVTAIKEEDNNLENTIEEIQKNEKVEKIEEIEKIEKIKPEKLVKQDEKQQLTSAQKGTLMHLALQKLAIKKELITSTDEEKQEAIKDLINNLNINEESKKELESKEQILIDYINSELYKDLSEAKQVFKETPFYMNIPYKNTKQNVLIQGVIDLYYISKAGKLILIDYKTDNVNSEEELKNKYMIQLQLYKEALERALKLKVTSTYIYSTKLRKSIKVL